MRPRIAVIDLGSAAARLAVYRLAPDGGLDVLALRREAVRLVAQADGTGVLQPEAMARTVLALGDMVAVCNEHRAPVVAVATSAVRDAGNRDEFVGMVAENTGVELRVLSGEEEARYAAGIALRTLRVGDGLVVEIGGGSMQAALLRAGNVERAASLPLGAVRVTERYRLSDPPAADELAAVRRCLTAALADTRWLDGRASRVGSSRSGAFVGIGGVVKSIARIHWHAATPTAEPADFAADDQVHAYRLSLDQARDVIAGLTRLTVAERLQLQALEPDRADIIVAAALLLDLLLERSGSSELTVCGYGIREALAYEALEATA